MRFRVRRLTLFLVPLTLLYISISSLLHGRQQVVENSDSLIETQHASLDESIQEIQLSNFPGYNNKKEDAKLWPKAGQPHDDRIVNQLEYSPNSFRDRILKYAPISQKMKTIFIPAGLGGNPPGRKLFIKEECPVNKCILEDDFSHRVTADAVIFHNEYHSTPIQKPAKNQIWILHLLECPLNTGHIDEIKHYINWTATYRTDSTIVTPYEKFVHFDNFTELPVKPSRDFALGKTKGVAWFVSNCNSGNRRFDYTKELQRHITVDIYGACGPLRCPRLRQQECNDILKKHYKFYLAFENSNCIHYITEKFYWNALFNDVIPIVMGARKEDYEAAAPPHSFIHVEDFDSPKELAEYLRKLDQNDDLYNSYFRWKDTGYFMNTKFWCRLCAMLHGAEESPMARWYNDVEKWWRNNNTCVEDRWDDPDGFIYAWDNFPF